MAVQGRAAICCSDGIQATRRITADHSGTRVVTLTMLVDAKMVLAAMRAGASGYVLKGAEQNELLRVVRVVAAGEMLFGASVARSTYCSRRATPRPRSSRSRNSHRDGSTRPLRPAWTGRRRAARPGPQEDISAPSTCKAEMAQATGTLDRLDQRSRARRADPAAGRVLGLGDAGGRGHTPVDRPAPGDQQVGAGHRVPMVRPARRGLHRGDPTRWAGRWHCGRPAAPSRSRPRRCCCAPSTTR